MVSTCSGVILPVDVIASMVPETSAWNWRTKALVFALVSQRQVVQHPVGSQGQHDHLLGIGLGLVQRLLEHLGQGFAVFQLAAGLSVQIRAELGKGLHILVLGQLDTQVGIGLFHGLGLEQRRPHGRPTGRH